VKILNSRSGSASDAVVLLSLLLPLTVGFGAPARASYPGLPWGSTLEAVKNKMPGGLPAPAPKETYLKADVTRYSVFRQDASSLYSTVTDFDISPAAGLFKVAVVFYDVKTAKMISGTQGEQIVQALTAQLAKEYGGSDGSGFWIDTGSQCCSGMSCNSGVYS
jgi:hypothetical protein